MNPVSVMRLGSGPIVLAQPHSSTYVPPDLTQRLNALGRELRDTDWHLASLYEGLAPDATIVRANFSRYVIDANRPPDGGSLYPGQNTTDLVPATTFDGDPIWDEPPDDSDIADRLARFHEPYHAALRGELDRVRDDHGFAVLYDCHSIRSAIPRLFDGRLPDLNVGTNNGSACGSLLRDAVAGVCDRQTDYSHVVDGRFKGGWTTRHYGQPQENVHAIQMELTQACYLQTETPPFAYDPHRAENLRRVLHEILNTLQQTLDNEFSREVGRGPSH